MELGPNGLGNRSNASSGHGDVPGTRNGIGMTADAKSVHADIPQNNLAYQANRRNGRDKSRSRTSTLMVSLSDTSKPSLEWHCKLLSGSFQMISPMM